MTTLFLFGVLMRSNYVQDYDKWVKAGRGQGRYSAYDPWITVQDCHSKTPRHRVPCPRLHRMLHCLSHGERLVCLSLEWNPEVIEIREQFPLAPVDTLDICSELNLIHPQVRGKNIVMTTDFLVTYRDDEGEESFKAFQVKENEDEVRKPRVNAKLTIEKMYWERKGIPWSVVFTSSLIGPKYDNIVFLNKYRNDIINDFHQLMLDYMTLLSSYPELSLRRLGEVCPSIFGNRYAVVSEPILKLAAHQKLDFDIDNAYILDIPVGDFKCQP
ncbi:TnsA endonuclease N-terminal domain-containing protein [Bilophila wadsworthia]|uniref:TnsA endonuclease N-terminal domain-containing protein n=1 Tax=Bilophila wadsworthia TaxID=35833 RepID=UPI003220001B